MIPNNETTNSKSRKWTTEEDNYLYNQIKDNPYNIHSCFLVVAKKMHRTVGAVSNRWYGKVSKDPKFCCFILLSNCHKTMNRKNGVGVPSTASIFQRVLRLLNISSKRQNKK